MLDERQVNFYLEERNERLPKDLVDYYVKEKFDITLGGFQSEQPDRAAFQSFSQAATFGGFGAAER